MPFYVAVKELQKSDLSWFMGPRRKLELQGSGRQRSIGMHVDVLKNIFPPHVLSNEEVVLYEYYDTGRGIAGPNRRPLLHQHKNWRLGGDVVREERFDNLRPGDYMLMLFRQHEHGKWLLAWDTVSQADSDPNRSSLYESLHKLGNDVMWLLTEPDLSDIIQDWHAAAAKLLKTILPPSTINIAREIQGRVEKNLMDLYLGTVASLSPLDQQEFARKVSSLASLFRKLLDGDILKIDRNHQSLWSDMAGQRIGFVDGGTASISALGTEPLAIRVGTYLVTPGDSSPSRESFAMRPQLVDQLFGPDADLRVFDEDPEESQISKVRDMARISLEAAGAVSALGSVGIEPAVRYLFLHGPLVNPVSPYADSPAFSDYGVSQLGTSSSEVKELVSRLQPNAPFNERHFIAVYRVLLDAIFSSTTPVVGVVERSAMARGVTRAVIQQRRGSSKRLLDRVIEEMKKYHISDAMLFAAVLNEGEYIRPFEIDKNDLRRASPAWERIIESYPKPWTTYFMLRQTALPVRIEMTRGSSPTEYLKPLSLLLHMSLLLPLYAFPVGLDIVDKYAKVPAWMSKQLSRHHAAVVLRHALTSGDIDLYNQIRLMLTQNVREWYLRPKHDAP